MRKEAYTTELHSNIFKNCFSSGFWGELGFFLFWFLVLGFGCLVGFLGLFCCGVCLELFCFDFKNLEQ